MFGLGEATELEKELQKALAVIASQDARIAQLETTVFALVEQVIHSQCPQSSRGRDAMGSTSKWLEPFITRTDIYGAKTVKRGVGDPHQ